MLKLFKRLKNDIEGYMMVYVVMLMAFITILFAGTAMALNSRTKVTSHTLESQQLQLTAQSALGTVVDEFENNADLKAKLEAYANGNQKADFVLTSETGVDDKINVAISKEPGEENKARITVTASNNSGSISTAFAIIDYSTPPQGDSAGVVDNLIVAFLPDGIEGSSQRMLCNGSDEQIMWKSVEGSVLVNNYGKNDLRVMNGSKIQNIIASGDIWCKNGEIYAVDTEGDGKIASTCGKVTFTNKGVLKGTGINLIAGKTGYEQGTDEFVWENEKLDIVTGDKGDMTITSMEGTIGSLTSGGKMTITPKDTGNLTINGSIMGTKDIVWNERGPGLKTTINGDFIGGEDITLNSKRTITIGGDLAAVANISGQGGGGSSSDAMNFSADNVYAGREVKFTDIGYGSFTTTGDILSGANYRVGDTDSENNYLANVTRGTVTLKGIQGGGKPVFSRVVMNDTSGKRNSIQGYEADTEHIIIRGESGFDDNFFAVNSNWLSDMKYVEKGKDSKHHINLATALRPSDVSSENLLTAWDNRSDNPKAYFKNSEDTYVSQYSYYTVDEGKHIVNSTIKDTFDDINYEFAQSIPCYEEAGLPTGIPTGQVPTVATPMTADQDYAQVRMNGNNLEVVVGGYIRAYGTYGWDPNDDKNTIYARNADSGELEYFRINHGDGLYFDTTGGKHYDIVVGSQFYENRGSASGTITFPWSIIINQPEEGMGYVRMFVDEKDEIMFLRGDVKDTDSVDTPEFYLFYNGNKRIFTDDYHLVGYIIAPHGLVDIFKNRVETVTNKVFEGIIICGNVGMPQNGNNERLVYKKPLTHASALTGDIYYYED